MSRAPRRESCTEVYHVVIRGNNQEDILKSHQEKEYFLQLMKAAKEKYSVKLYAYCIMRNHVHIMIKAALNVLADYMRYLNTQFAVYYNKKYDRCGHVFQERYFSDCIESEEYFWSCLRYIHNNPVKIHLVSKPLQYQYSSAREYQEWYHLKPSEMIDVEAFLMIQTRFQNFEQLWKFHDQFEFRTFKDIREEEELAVQEILCVILQQFLAAEHVETPDVIMAVGAYKNKFIKICKEKTGISGKCIQNFLKTVVKGDRHL